MESEWKELFAALEGAFSESSSLIYLICALLLSALLLSLFTNTGYTDIGNVTVSDSKSLFLTPYDVTGFFARAELDLNIVPFKCFFWKLSVDTDWNKSLLVLGVIVLFGKDLKRPYSFSESGESC